MCENFSYIFRLSAQGVQYFAKQVGTQIIFPAAQRLKKTIMHKELGRQVSYQYLIRLEAYKLIKHLIGEKEYEGFKIWW